MKNIVAIQIFLLFIINTLSALIEKATVEELHELSSIGISNKTIAIVSGYHTFDDGAGGPKWVYNTSSFATHNAGTVIRPDNLEETDPGRWHRPLIGEVTVEYFGAKEGDGLDDTPKIQAAIDYVTGSGGGVVYIPMGVYDIDGTLNVPDAGNQSLTIRGDGDNATVLKSTDSSDVIDFTFAATFTDTLLLEDVSILASGSGDNGTAVKVSYASDPPDVGRGGFVANRVLIHTLGDESYFSKGISISHGWNTQITNCYFKGNSNTQGTAIEFTNKCNNSLVSGCRFHLWQYAIDIVSTPSIMHEGIRIDNCIMVDVNRGVSAIADSAKWNLWLTLTNSHIDAKGAGSKCIDITHWHDVFVRGNILYTEPSSGSGYHLVGKIQRSIISDNTCYGFGVSGSGGIVIQSTSEAQGDRNIIKGNIFYNMTNAYAIWLQTGTTRNTVTNNVIGSTVVNKILNQGTNQTIVDNHTW